MKDPALLKPVSVNRFDLEWIAMWMEGQVHMEECCFDVEAGETLMESDFVERESREDAFEDPRYVWLGSVDSREGFRYMEQFTNEADMPDPVRHALLDALDRPKPFRRFKDALREHEAQLDAFERYKTDRIIEEEFRALLERQGYRLVIEECAGEAG